MLSRNGISKLHFLLSLTSCDFWSPFCPFPSFLLSLNSLPQWHTFCNCKILSSESPFALFPPHSALDLLSDVNPRLQCAPDLALHMAKALGRASATTSASFFICKAQVSHCPEKWTWEIHFSLQYAELGGVSYKGTQVRCEGREYSSSGYSLTLLCDFISKRKRKGNKKTLHKTPKPLSPSDWELLAYFLEKYLKYLMLNFLLDESWKGLYKICAEITVSSRCLSFS